MPTPQPVPSAAQKQNQSPWSTTTTRRLAWMCWIRSLGSIRNCLNMTISRRDFILELAKQLRANHMRSKEPLVSKTLLSGRAVFCEAKNTVSGVSTLYKKQLTRCLSQM
ncbi:hypothetical protein GOODEAATRI_023422 [Goodea atripinnis]|uniref:Uncharacterized protein n=1 Tax=Goodea atripinnis TaxID=208336 RepID=A0ABV0N3U0_9TELE